MADSLKIKSTAPAAEPTPKEETPVNDKIKEDWNKYLNWLEQKKVRGKADLDKGGVGNAYFNQYIKENPDTSLSTNVIPEIRKEYLALRNKGLENIRTGKINYSQGPIESYMRNITLNELSKDPNYVGQHLTQTYFPGYELTEKETGKVISKKATYNKEENAAKSVQ